MKHPTTTRLRSFLSAVFTGVLWVVALCILVAAAALQTGRWHP